MKRCQAALAALILVLSAHGLWAQEGQGPSSSQVIGLGKVLAFEDRGGVPLPGYPDPQKLALRLFELAARRAAFLDARFEAGAQAPDFRISLTFARDEAEKSLFCALKLLSADAEDEWDSVGESTVILSSVDEIEIRVSSAIAGLWARHSHKPREGRAPLPVSQLDASLVIKALGGYDQSYPMDMAMGPGGRLYLPVYSSIAVVEGDFRFLRGLSADGKGGTIYPYKLGVTPSGIIAFQTATPGELIRLDPAKASVEKASTGLRSQGRMAVLEDGSVVMDDWGSSPARIVRGRRSEAIASGIILPAGPALAADAEGNIWAWDHASKSARVYSAEGRLVADLPAIASDLDDFFPSFLIPLPGGAFILGNASAFRRFDAAGFQRSSVKRVLSPADPDSLLSINALAADPATGSIFILDMMRKTIIRYQDPDWLTERGLDAALPPGVWEALRALEADPDSEAAALALVKAWKASGAQEAACSLARAFLERMDSPGLEKLERELSLAFEKASCLIKMRQASDVLERLGPESAAGPGILALQAFEAYLALAPGDLDMRRLMEELRAKLRGPSLDRPKRELFTIVSASVDPLFPARSPGYRERAPARAVIKNTSGQALDDLRISLMIDGYMDAPSEIRLEGGLKAGEERSIPIPLTLSPSVLGLTEDLALRARLGVEARLGSELDSRTLGVDLTIHRRSAISWEDSAALASFVTPHDSAVSFFASRSQAAAGGDWLGRPFSRALAVLEAMGEEGILYTPDPASPYGKAGVVDTVRYPRQCLELGSGDCDDTTALAVSLLEAVGIPCAIITTPGHIFLAFDAGQDTGMAWLYAGGAWDCLKEGGTLWIPIESTILAKGFPAAWEEGLRLWHANPGSRELIPLAAARTRYPAVSPAEGLFSPLPPDAARLASRIAASRAALDAGIVQGLAACLRSASATGDSASRHKALNKLAVLLAMTGDQEAAEEALRSSLALGSGSAQSAANLSILLESQGRSQDALAVLEEGLRLNPSSAVLKRLHGEQLARAGRAGSAPAVVGGSEQQDLAGGAGHGSLVTAGPAPGDRASEAAAAPRWIIEE